MINTKFMKHPIIEFLEALSLNNSKEWFDANPAKYNQARNELIEITNELINDIAKYDPSIGLQSGQKCLYRQNRDLRFSANKSPYKTTMSAFIAPGGKSSGNPGYYIHFETGQSFIGGGVYAPSPTYLHAIRTEIYYHTQEFKEILNDPAFIATFGAMMDERLLRVPKGFSPDSDVADLLKYKHYVVMHSFNPNLSDTGEIIALASEVFRKMHAFNAFLFRAILNLE